MIVISFALFIAASQADNYARGFLLALAGAMVPLAGAVVMILTKMQRWRRMGFDLGLVLQGSGAYPDFTGRYEGKRLTVLRRIDPYARGAKDSTVLRLEGHGEVRLPGTVGSAETVRSVLEPLLHQKTTEPVAA